MNDRQDVVQALNMQDRVPSLGGCGGCGCEHDDHRSVCGFGVEYGVLAAVYAPLQRFEGVYDPDSAWRRGTMFEALDKPFYGDGREVDCRGQQRQK